MTHIANDDLGTLFDHIADVIEGGSDYNSGTAMQGIPGLYSNDPKLMDGSDDDVTASANGTTTAVPFTGSYFTQGRWKKPASAGYFLLCTGATNTENVNEARRITDWVVATRQFTVDAFPAAVSSGDTFVVRQGFRWVPDDQSLLDDDTPGAFDRFFELDIDDGLDRNIRGKGVATREATLVVRLRLLHHQRMKRAKKSAMANAAILREGLMNVVNRSSNLACVLAGGGTVIGEPDDYKIDVAISIPIIYRMNTAL